MSSNPMDTQVGGDHYSRLPIQPSEISHKNKLWGEGPDIIKRVIHYFTSDNPDPEELWKAKHSIDMALHMDGHPAEKPDEITREERERFYKQFVKGDEGEFYDQGFDPIRGACGKGIE